MNTEILVIAVKTICEENFADEAEFTHALPGDTGTAEDADFGQGCVTVRWHRTGTATLCFPDEFRLASR